MTTEQTLDINHQDPKLDELLFKLINSPEGRSNPYPIYNELLHIAPVFKSTMGSYVLLKYDDCQKVLRDNRFGKAENTPEERKQRAELIGLTQQEIDEAAQFFESRGSMLFVNPPDHTRLRSLVSRAFTPKTVDRMRDHVKTITDDLLDNLDGEVDIMEQLAWVLPATVISELIGVPFDQREIFRPLVRSATMLLEPVISRDDFLAGLNASKTMTEILTQLLDERRKNPRDDLMSSLIEVKDGSDRLSERELIATCQLLYAAGFETTTNLIGNGLFALLSHPDQLELLKSNPELTVGAVEELLRYDSPVQFDGRTALLDADINGQHVDQGAMVFTILGAANHDFRHFHNPEVLDITRDEGPPLSFASGIHYCLGNSLARMEGQVVLRRLLDTFNVIELIDQNPERRNSITLRGIKQLRVNLKR
jgi:cytochrome P450